MDQVELPDEIMHDLRQMCGEDPSAELRLLVARFLRCKHRVTSGPVSVDVLAVLASVAQCVKEDAAPPANPFAGTAVGTKLSVMRIDSNEVICDATFMSVGQGLHCNLVKVAMHDDEREPQEFDYRQIRLREAPLLVQPTSQGPIEVIPDVPEKEEEQTSVPPEQPAERKEESTFPDEEVVESAKEFDGEWAKVDSGVTVWLESGEEGIFLGLDEGTDFLKVRVPSRQSADRFSLFEADEVRLAVEIPVEHEPVDVGAK